MPMAPLHPCAEPRCPALVPSGTARCAAHAVPSWRGQGPTPHRVRGRQLQRLREQLFDEQPLCVLCLQEGRTTVATIRDHIVPLAEGSVESKTNDGCQALCRSCSDVKTAAESARGRARNRR
jgi:5-methylcytosine-specific restriction protein A